MYQCARCGLTRASGQEIGVIQKCKCPWEFVPPVAPQRTWVGLTDKDWNRSKHNYDFQKGVDWAESILKEKNT